MTSFQVQTSSVRFIFAPPEIRRFTMVWWPLNAASCSADLPNYEVTQCNKIIYQIIIIKLVNLLGVVRKKFDVHCVKFLGDYLFHSQLHLHIAKSLEYTVHFGLRSQFSRLFLKNRNRLIVLYCTILPIYISAASLNSITSSSIVASLSMETTFTLREYTCINFAIAIL